MKRETTTTPPTPEQKERTTMEAEGQLTGGEVSVIIIDAVEAGAGPRLHRHPYPETFVLVTGEVHFGSATATLSSAALAFT